MLALRKIGVRSGVAVAVVLSMIGPAWAQTDDLIITQQQLQILAGLGALVALLAVIGAMLLSRLQRDSKDIADAGGDKVRERYYALPLGVPEGTIRSLISVLIIIVGLAVLIVQKPLGIDSSDAIVGFVSAVITFYFVTRSTQQATGALQDSTDALTTAVQNVTQEHSDLTAKVGFAKAWMRSAKAEEEAVRKGPLSEKAVRDEVARFFRPLVEPWVASDKVATRMNDVGAVAKVDRVNRSLKRESDLMRPYKDDFSLESNIIAADSMDGKLSEFETKIGDALVDDLKHAGVGITP